MCVLVSQAVGDVAAPLPSRRLPAPTSAYQCLQALSSADQYLSLREVWWYGRPLFRRRPTHQARRNNTPRLFHRMPTHQARWNNPPSLFHRRPTHQAWWNTPPFTVPPKAYTSRPLCCVVLRLALSGPCEHRDLRARAAVLRLFCGVVGCFQASRHPTRFPRRLTSSTHHHPLSSTHHHHPLSSTHHPLSSSSSIIHSSSSLFSSLTTPVINHHPLLSHYHPLSSSSTITTSLYSCLNPSCSAFVRAIGRERGRALKVSS